MRRPLLAASLGRSIAGDASRRNSRFLRREFALLLSDNGFGRFKRDKNQKPTTEGEGLENKKESQKEKEVIEPEKKKEEIKDKKDEEDDPQIRVEKLKDKILEELKKLQEEKSKGSGSGKATEDGNQSEKKENQQNASPPPPPPQSTSRTLFNYFLIGFGVMFLLGLIGGSSGSSALEITIDQFFQDFVKYDKVSTVNITRTLLGTNMPVYTVEFKSTSAEDYQGGYFFSIHNLEEFICQLNSMMPNKKINFVLQNNFSERVSQILHSGMNSEIVNLLILGVMFYILRMVFKHGASNIQRQNKFDEMNLAFMNRLRKDSSKKSSNKVNFADVAGMDEAKKEITEFVDFLTNKEQFVRLGAKIPRGALLTGPPGTGKTLLAKACANESKVPFISVSGSDFVEMYVGVGSSRIRALFEVAKESAPCIVFIDEIDAIAKKRSEDGGRGGNEERESTLNQLLVEMDGFGSQTNIIVFAATNMKDSLDAALLRPGRFDRIIDVSLPDIEARKKIFLIHLKKITLDLSSKKIEDYANRLSTLTPGFSGAQIESICNEAAIIAARKDALVVQQAEFEQAVERVIAGLERHSKVDQEQRKLNAVHESGKAVVSWFLKNGPPLLKLTIIPRSKSSRGFSQYLANENMLNTKSDLIDLICISLSGTLSEEVILGKRTTSAADDLQKAERLAHQLVTTFGMSELGPIHRTENEYGFKSYSESVNLKIDQEKLKIVKECEHVTRDLLKDKLPLIHQLSEELLAKETLNFIDIKRILGERPFPPRGSYKQYLDEIGSIDMPDKDVQQQGNQPVAISHPETATA